MAVRLPRLWLRRGLVALTLPLAVGAGVTVVPNALPGFTAQAQDIDSLMAELEIVSRDAEAKTEEVKTLELQIEEQRKAVDELNREWEQRKVVADEALTAEQDAKKKLDRVARAEYRTLGLDPITEVLSASGPDSAISRTAYLSSMAYHTQEVIDQRSEATKVAAEAANEMARAKAQADFARREFEHSREDLLKEKEVLDEKTKSVRKAIDSLSIEERLAWAARHNPSDYNLDGLTGTSPEAFKALQAAFTKRGAPYSWGAAGPDMFDCSGLVVWSYAQQGKILPRTSQAQMAGGMPVSRDELQPGDVVGFYPGATHVGIYAGNGMIIHASDYGIPVQVVPMDSMPYYGARRY